jgi:hypothetical protein
MEIELLWPLVQELVTESEVSPEDWVFLKQNAETLSCSEPVLQALLAARQSAGEVDPLRRLQALTHLTEAMGAEATRKVPFLLEVAEFLQVPVELMKVLLQVPRKPALRFLVQLRRSISQVPQSDGYEPWIADIAHSLKVERTTLEALQQFLGATDQKHTGLALRAFWKLLLHLESGGAENAERAYLFELAREARLSDTVVKGLEAYVRATRRGQEAIEALATLVRSLSEKAPPSQEDMELLKHIASEVQVPEPLLQALVELENLLRQRRGGMAFFAFGGEAIEPLIRQLVAAHMESKAQTLLDGHARELGLSQAQLSAMLTLEKLVFEKTAKFPQHIQPLVQALVEKARISDDKLLYLVRKAQEVGGSEKVVRSLVQIEIASQKKAMPAVELKPPPPPSEPVLMPEKPSIPPPSSPPPKLDPPSEPPNDSLVPSSVDTRAPASSISSDIKSPATLSKTFPKGGHFPPLSATFSFIKAFAFRTEKDRLRKCEVFPKGGRVHWYAIVDYEGSHSVVIVRGKPEHRIEEVLQAAASPTGDVLAIKMRVAGGIRVYVNGDESLTYEEVGSFIFSPNGRHVAYIAVKGQDHYAILDNGALRPYLYISELTFHPTAEADLYYIAQVEKNKWVVLDNFSKPHSETHAALGGLIFAPNGNRSAYAYLRNRKFQVFDGKNTGEPYDRVGDLSFTPDSAHIVYSAHRGKAVEVLWDHKPLCTAEGIMSLTIAPNGQFVAYIAREKEGQAVYLHNKKLGTYEKVDKILIPAAPKPTVIYIVEYNGRHHIFINGAPESGPYEHISLLSGRGESFAAIVRKDKETVAVVHNGQLGGAYTNIPLLVWDESGKQLAYPARRRPGWSGVVWNGRESDHYDYPQHLTFGAGGQALLFFARRRDGWYAVLNDQPIPETLCAEILTPPVYDEKSKSFYYLYRKEKEVYEGKIALSI